MCGIPVICNMIINSAGIGRCTDYGSTQIQNGYRTIEGTTEGDMVAFGCSDGYDLIGNRQLTCGSNSLWTGAWPICARGQCSNASVCDSIPL